jgi:DNA-binding NtrC family response regulator
VTVLLVCADELRMIQLQAAIGSAGFRLISAKAIDEAWAKIDFFDFGAVVIDYQLKDDIAAAAFRQRFITLNLNEDAGPESVVMELTNLFNKGSELVQ